MSIAGTEAALFPPQHSLILLHFMAIMMMTMMMMMRMMRKMMMMMMEEDWIDADCKTIALHGTSFLSGVREATANDRRSKSCLRGVVAWISNSKNKHGKESERYPRGFFKIKTDKK